MTTTFWNVRLLDGLGGAPVDDATVAIEDGRNLLDPARIWSVIHDGSPVGP